MNTTSFRAFVYFLKIVASRVAGFLLYAFGTGWVVDSRSVIYFGYCIAASIASGAWMMLANPETFAERDKISPDTPFWDKAILLAYWLLSFFGIYLVAGLEATNTLPLNALFWLGMLICFLSTVIQIAALAVNTFLESSARLQEDRGQSVVDKGVYRAVRHPAYASILLWCISVALIFPTPFVWLTVAIIAVLIVVRTALEDKLLLEGLPGYREYAKRTRWRVIPFIW